MTTRNEILQSIEETLLRAKGVSDVYIGAIAPHLAETRSKCMIWWERDAGQRKDGDLMERRLRLIVGLLFKVDPTSATKARTALLEMSRRYDEVHAVLEELANDFVGGKVRKMDEAEEGVEPANFEDSAEAKFIGSAWDITYQRQRRAT